MRRAFALAAGLWSALAPALLAGPLGRAGAAAWSAPVRDAETPARDVAEVISGGVSLGAYQAGGTWAQLALMRARHPERRLAVVTGASAGNINAFLAAIDWCDTDSASGRIDRTVFANPFFDVWADIGWEKLSPARMPGRTYARLFDAPVGSATFQGVSRGVAAGRVATPWFDAETPYTPQDGLFTRAAFAAAEAFLVKRLTEARTTRGTCEVALGVTVTREAAAFYPVESAGAGGRVPRADAADRAGLRVPTQRYVVPLRLVVDGEGGHLRNALTPTGGAWFADRSHGRIAKALHLPTRTPGGDIEARALLDLVRASSAFPVAFAPVRLSVCLAGGDLGGARREATGHCPPGTQAASERFADGGFFDNVPLGLAIELVADRPASERGTPVTFEYVDPESRRRPSAPPKPRKPVRGLEQAWQTLGDALAEARTFELQGLARYAADEIACDPARGCAGPPRDFRASSRFHPIVGAALVHNFAAFTHRVFRVHDYLVGVYDALMVDADGARLGPTVFHVAALVEAFAGRLATLGLAGAPLTPGPDGLERADELLWRLLRDELLDRTPAASLAAYCRLADARPEVCGPDGGWRQDDFCLARPTARVPCRGAVLAVHDVLRAIDREGGSEHDFDPFVTAYGRLLVSQGLALPAPPTEAPSSALQFDGAVDPGAHRTFTRDTWMRLLERAIDVEVRDEAVYAALGRRPSSADREVLGLSTRVLGSAGMRFLPLLGERPQERLDLDPSTVEAYARTDAPFYQRAVGGLLHVFPWGLGWDARRLGPTATWEPRFDLLDSPVTPRLHYTAVAARDTGELSVYHRAGFGVARDGWLGYGGLLTAGGPQPRADGPWGLGVAAHVDLARSLRLTLGLDRVVRLRDLGPGPTELMFAWSLLDVNGGLAWLLLAP